jgi:hypothetical protein
MHFRPPSQANTSAGLNTVKGDYSGVCLVPSNTACIIQGHKAACGQDVGQSASDIMRLPERDDNKTAARC